MRSRQFCSRALSLVFLLCGRFAPFYKWKLRAALDLPEPYAGIASGVRALMQPGCENVQDRIEALAAQIISHLAAQGLAQSESDFLADYKPLVEQSIRDEEIRNMPGLY